MACRISARRPSLADLGHFSFVHAFPFHYAPPGRFDYYQVDRFATRSLIIERLFGEKKKKTKKKWIKKLLHCRLGSLSRRRIETRESFSCSTLLFPRSWSGLFSFILRSLPSSPLWSVPCATASLSTPRRFMEARRPFTLGACPVRGADKSRVAQPPREALRLSAARGVEARLSRGQGQPGKCSRDRRRARRSKSLAEECPRRDRGAPRRSRSHPSIGFSFSRVFFFFFYRSWFWSGKNICGISTDCTNIYIYMNSYFSIIANVCS